MHFNLFFSKYRNQPPILNNILNRVHIMIRIPIGRKHIPIIQCLYMQFNRILLPGRTTSKLRRGRYEHVTISNNAWQNRQQSNQEELKLLVHTKRANQA